MADQPTPVAGAALRRIKGDKYVVVRISQMFPGAPPTIQGLATRLRLQPDLVFQCLLHYVSNAPAVIAMYEDQIGGTVPSDLELARRRLMAASTRFTADDDFPTGTETPYVRWGVSPRRDAPIVLPFAPGFRDVMSEAAAQRKREQRIKASRPAFEELPNEIREIRIEARNLDSTISLSNGLAKDHASEIALLTALNGLLDALLKYPKKEVKEERKAAVRQLQQSLTTLIDEANQNMILNPPDVFRAGLIRDRNQLAGSLRQRIEDPKFVAHIGVLAQHKDIAPFGLLSDTHDALRLAYMTLLASPESDHILEQHVIPLINSIASRPMDMQGLAAPHLPEFEKELASIPAETRLNSALVILAGSGGALPQALANTPGPDSLAECIVALAAPQLMPRVVGNMREGSKLSARLYRFLVNVAGLDRQQRLKLIAAIDRGQLQELREIQWNERFMTGQAYGWAVAIASVICLAATIQKDDLNTLRRWADIINSSTGIALGAQLVIGRYFSLVRQGIGFRIGGSVLGVVGGLAAAVSGALTAEEEFKTGDRVGGWVAVATASGGVLSVAGFLVGAGVSSSSTGVGATVGAVLMAMGAILGIGAGAYATIRSVVTAGSQMIFEAFINQFGRQFGPYAEAAKERGSLRQAFEVVQTSHHCVDFWEVHTDKIPELFDLGFGEAHIEQIVDEDAATVTNRLRVANRI